MEKLFPESDVEAVEVWGTLKWTCFFHIMRSTGFRPGEIAGLRRSDFYPELAGIYTTSSVNSYERKIVERIKTTGKGKPYKIGLLTQQCVRLMKIYIDSLPEEQEYLLLVRRKPMTVYSSNKHFVTFASRIKDFNLSGRTQYCLRHTFQTSVAGEIEKAEVEELMGHTRFRQDYDHRDGERRLRQLQPLRKTLEEIV